VTGLAFAPDGSRLLSAGWDQSLACGTWRAARKATDGAADHHPPRPHRGLGPSAEPEFARGWPLLEGILAAAERALTRGEIHRRWPDPGVVPAKLTLWRWLDRVVKEGKVLQDGLGTRKDPYRYRLPGMVEKWQADFLASFTKQLEAGAGPAEATRGRPDELIVPTDIERSAERGL
jgi:hypothetical protein